MIARQLAKHNGAIAGGAVLFFIVLVAVLAPQFLSHDPIEISSDRFLPPSWVNLMGTDQLGRDIFTRVVYGARISLVVGLVSVLIAGAIGIPLGLVAGYNGGWIDNAIMRSMDVMLAFPGVLLAIVVVAILGPGLTNAMIAIGVANIPSYARLVRGSTLAESAKSYVEAARLIGVPTIGLIFRHILPNVMAPILVLSTMGVASSILAAAGLSYVGLGATPPTPEWGAMLSQGRQYLASEWWLSTFPGLAIFVTVLGINLLGDGVRDALDPRLRV